MSDINTQKSILKTLPAVMGNNFKKINGKGPTRQKIHFTDDGIIINIFGFLNDTVQKDCREDPQVHDTLKIYYYKIIKNDIQKIRQYFQEKHNLQVDRVYCDFDCILNEGVIVFRVIEQNKIKPIYQNQF